MTTRTSSRTGSGTTLPTAERLAVAVESFAAELLDDDRASFSFAEADALARSLGYSVAVPVIRALVAYGFTAEPRAIPRRVRGFQTSSNDRWFGPGSEKTHGGSGFDNRE